jgi:hypothetical protein
MVYLSPGSKEKRVTRQSDGRETPDAGIQQ